MNKSSSSETIWTEVTAIARTLGSGDRSAMTRLYDVTAPRLLRYAMALTRNRADGEDSVQSALVRIARKPQLLANADRPWAYLVRVVRNEALKIVERRRPILSLSKLLQAWRPDECPLEQEESRALVQKAVRRLPPEQAEVIVLKIWEEFTFAEVADLVGESPNTVASRYRYAIEKLERSLQSFAAPAESETIPSREAAAKLTKEVGHV